MKLFTTGLIVFTPGAEDALLEAKMGASDLVNRHISGDWGDLSEEDKKENEFSVKNGFRILSAYILPTQVKVWVITEWDRSVTTLLLPDEY